MSSNVEIDPIDSEVDMAPFSTVMGEKLPTEGIPEGKFEAGRKMVFDGAIAAEFEEKVMPRQIPGYKEMRLRLLHVAVKMVQKDTVFADIGTSWGRMIRDTIAALVTVDPTKLNDVHFIGTDLEQAMLDKASALMEEIKAHPELKRVVNENKIRSRSVLDIDNARPKIDLYRHDLRSGLHPSIRNASVITSVMVLQFVPMEHRPRVLKEVYESLVPGGAFIFAEKVLEPNHKIDDLLSIIYYEDKERNGIPHDDILRKRGSLENYLVPLTDKGNRELLQGAGFRAQDISVFWRNLQFQAYIAIK